MRIMSAFILGLLMGCSGTRYADTQGDDYTRFAALPYQERRVLISELPPDLRVEAYLDMIIEEHPPDVSLAVVVGRGGQPVVDAVSRRLDEDRDAMNLSYLTLLLWEVQNVGSADVRRQSQLVRRLETAIEAISDPIYKERSRYFLNKILGTE